MADDGGDMDGDYDPEDHGAGISLCCPKCGSKNVELKESKEGYFWVYHCHNCGHKGKEGEHPGCLNEDDARKGTLG